MDASSSKRTGRGKFSVKSIDPFLCTDIVFGFLTIDVHNLSLKNIEEQHEVFQNEILELKTEWPTLRVLLAVGGEEVGDIPFLEISESLSTLIGFSKNVASQLGSMGFDGLEIAWTTQNIGNKNRITHICRALHEAFERASITTGQDKLLLTLAALPYGMTSVLPYDPAALNQYLDRITVLAFNYDTPTTSMMLHNSALDNNTSFSIKTASMNWWTLNHVPAKKLILGIAAFGRTFDIPSGWSNTTPGNRRIWNKSAPGPYTQTAGYLSFYEICYIQQHKAWKVIWNDMWAASVAVSLRNNYTALMIHPNSRSFEEKAELVKEEHYGGIMISSLDLDDFDGQFCNLGYYPLLKAAASRLRSKAKSEASKTNDYHDVMNYIILPVVWLLLVVNVVLAYKSGTKQIKVTESLHQSNTYRFF